MIEVFTYTVFSLIFNTSYHFSEPKDAGLHAKIMFYNVKNIEQLSVTFVLFSHETQNQMKMNDSELINYSKTTFLGTSKAATSKKERTILNKKSEGEVLATKIPVPSDIEIHLITLPNRDKIVIGFKSIKEMPENIRENIISEIFKSITIK
jgi:hypothetical protein